MAGVMDALTGTHGLLSLENGGNNRGSGTVSMSFTITSASAYSFGGTSSNSVGTMNMSFGVSQTDTEQSILNKINSVFNDNTILDIAKTSANPEYFSIGSLSTRNTMIDTPIYGGVCKIQIQSGVEAGQFIDIIYDTLGLLQLGISGTDIKTVDNAQEAIQDIKEAMGIISEQRSTFGAYQNRLEHAYDVNKNTSENTQAGESRIRDTDMSAEMVEYSKHNILEQAGTSMLAQANQASQGIMGLLQ
ncbi:MAG: hypothetical protein K6B44_03395 [Lachnospiraceae bacterium]|nr:hypothetical protein [Lachnospiraceae bacterium]